MDRTRTTSRDGFRTAGTVLIFMGVMVWVVYAVLRWGFGQDLPLDRFVEYHLCGVIPGSILRHRSRVARWLVRFGAGKR